MISSAIAEALRTRPPQSTASTSRRALQLEQVNKRGRESPAMMPMWRHAGQLIRSIIGDFLVAERGPRDTRRARKWKGATEAAPILTKP
jgi:hypothetical protein